MGKAQILEAIGNFLVKPEKFLTVHKNPVRIKEFTCALKDGELTAQAEASLGDASLFIERLLQLQRGKAKNEVFTLFDNLASVQQIQNRSKGALSINTKILRGLKKAEGQQFNNINEAISCIKDGIGSRVITKSLEKLSKPQIETMIAEQKLCAEDAALLRKYIYQEPLNATEVDKGFALFEEFARPLVEARSKEVVDKLTLGILKNRIIKGETTIQELKTNGLFRDDLIKRLEVEKIEPIEITTINNYRGEHGLAEFSNNQIRQLSLAFGEDSNIIIKSDARGLSKRWPPDKIQELSADSIKASGYRTAQMNVIHQNGALGEIQFRGEYTNIIGEYEHIAYDLRQGKNTLGKIFNDFEKAIKDLSPDEYNEYNKYLGSCYNYYNRLELGLPAIKPKLPSKFPQILSEESMKTLHDANDARQKILEQTFSRGFAA